MEAERAAIKLVRSTERKIWMEFMGTLVDQCRLRLTGKQGVSCHHQSTPRKRSRGQYAFGELCESDGGC